MSLAIRSSSGSALPLNACELRCERGWREKTKADLCEIPGFQFTGTCGNSFRFQSIQFSFLEGEALTSGLKTHKRSLNHKSRCTFKLSRGRERGREATPAAFPGWPWSTQHLVIPFHLPHNWNQSEVGPQAPVHSLSHMWRPEDNM